LHAYLKSTDAQICINNGARDALIKLRWISAENSYVVYNSIDVSRFSPNQDRTAARMQLNLPHDALLLGMVCRLVWEKGCADLLSIIERLPARWHGVICGDGPLRVQLEQECQRRGIADRIHFLGLQDDVRPVYAALDAYAFLSRYEPFGLVLAEAMAAGVPVFGIEGDGEYKEAEYPLVKGDTAALVSLDGLQLYREVIPETILDQVAQRVEKYGADPQCCGDMIARARRSVSESFAAPVQAEVMSGVYERICGIGDMSPQKVSDWYQSKHKAATMKCALKITGRERATA
jgi:UDP-glucose:(heptosyl)LPS alpha-1,3-glucosyltransferase